MTQKKYIIGFGILLASALSLGTVSFIAVAHGKNQVMREFLSLRALQQAITVWQESEFDLTNTIGFAEDKLLDGNVANKLFDTLCAGANSDWNKMGVVYLAHPEIIRDEFGIKTVHGRRINVMIDGDGDGVLVVPQIGELTGKNLVWVELPGGLVLMAE